MTVRRAMAPIRNDTMKSSVRNFAGVIASLDLLRKLADAEVHRVSASLHARRASTR